MRLSLLVLVVLAVAACQSDKIDNSTIVDPGPSVSFAADIQPIFNRSCGGVGCHIGEATNGVNLTNYESVMASEGLQYDGPTVVAGRAVSSPLLDKISPNPEFGSRMPLGQGALPSEDIALIRAWINDGAQNN